MNVAFFLKPKAQVAYLYDDYTIRQSLEKMRHHGYRVIPVINKEGKYIGVVSEGDFLWYLIDSEQGDIVKTNIKEVEDVKLSEAINIKKPEAASITATADDLLEYAMRQNFVSVVDDTNSFIGIVTRQDIIKYLSQK